MIQLLQSSSITSSMPQHFFYMNRNQFPSLLNAPWIAVIGISWGAKLITQSHNPALSHLFPLKAKPHHYDVWNGESMFCTVTLTHLHTYTVCAPFGELELRTHRTEQIDRTVSAKGTSEPTLVPRVDNRVLYCRCQGNALCSRVCHPGRVWGG